MIGSCACGHGTAWFPRRYVARLSRPLSARKSSSSRFSTLPPTCASWCWAFLSCCASPSQAIHGAGSSPRGGEGHATACLSCVQPIWACHAIRTWGRNGSCSYGRFPGLHHIRGRHKYLSPKRRYDIPLWHLQPYTVPGWYTLSDAWRTHPTNGWNSLPSGTFFQCRSLPIVPICRVNLSSFLFATTYYTV